MPVYNAEQFLTESLESVHAQTYQQWKLLIVDDGSTDGSPDICRKFQQQHPEKCFIYKSPKECSGAAACRNIALANCNDDFVIFLDADDKLEPFCLEQRMGSNPEKFDLAVFKEYQWVRDFDKPMQVFNNLLIQTRDAAITAFLQMDAPWQTMAPIWKKKALAHLGGFDETLTYMEDPDLHLRALSDNSLEIGFAYDRPADSFYRVNNMSVTKANNFYDNSIRSRFLFIKKSITRLDNEDSKTKTRSKNAISKGYRIFLKTFVLSRLEKYISETLYMNAFLQKKKVISRARLQILNAICKVFLSQSPLVKVFKLKGLANRFV